MENDRSVEDLEDWIPPLKKSEFIYKKRNA
jgi:hypothetical protein